MAIFGPKPWVNLFGKMLIFPLFELLVFIARNAFFQFFLFLDFIAWKGVFSLQNILKHIFLSYIGYKRKFEKWAFLDQNHGLNPLEKCQFFDFFDFSFYSLERRFFALKHRKRRFPAVYFPKKKSWKCNHFWTFGNMAIFGPKRQLKPFAKMLIFQLFGLLVFIA